MAILVATGAGSASGATVVVKPSAMDGWAFRSVGTGTGGFELGPLTPPLGAGSAELKVGANTDGSDRIELRNTNYNGVRLADLSRLTYSSFVTQEASYGCVAPYILLSVDVNADGVFDTGTVDDGLFFEPCYQTGTYITDPPGQTIPAQCPNAGDPQCFDLGKWHGWNALVGGWWSANYNAPPGGGPPLMLMSTYLNKLAGLGYPNPKIINTSSCLGGVRIQAGPGPPVWNNFEGNADNLTVGVSGSDTTYDFEYENLPIPGCRAGTFSCRATAARVLSLKLSQANPPDSPCRTDDQHLVKVGNPAGNVFAGVANASTQAAPTTPPQSGDTASADASTVSVKLVVGTNTITAKVVEAHAQARCEGGATPVLSGNSKVVGLVVNGVPRDVGDTHTDIPLVLATLHLNHTITAGGKVTQRAIWLENNLIGDVVVSEAEADSTGHPCSNI